MHGWLAQRKELYRQLKAQIDHLLGEESSGLKSYRLEYDRTFHRPQSWAEINREEFLERIAKARVLFLADFHALQQSQKTQVQILDSLMSMKDRKKQILCLECIEFRHQKKVDDFMKGKMSETDFLKKIKWQQSWGFPWEFYRPLFLWAKRSQVPIIGLNKYVQSRSASSCKKRDNWAAQILFQTLNRYPEHQILVVYGDFHLAQAHLPSALLRKATSLTVKDLCVVFQNSEKIYFYLFGQNNRAQPEVVKRGNNHFCVFSISPWVKLQNYLLFLEKQFDISLGAGENQSGKIGDAFTEIVENYCQLLSKDLDVPFIGGSFSVYSAEDDVLFEKLSDFYQGPALRWFEYLVAASRSFYAPEIHLAFLGYPSINMAASLAMAVLYSKVAQSGKSIYDMPEDFTRLIFSEAIQYFGSKLINPKRRVNIVADVRGAFSRSSFREAKDFLTLALVQKMKEISPAKSKISNPPVRCLSSYYEAARLLGSIMGEKIYNNHQKGFISTFSIRSWMKQDIHRRSFHSFYRKLTRELDSLPSSFESGGGTLL